MSINLPGIFVEQFTSNVDLLLQQRGSKLRSTVRNQPCYGKQSVAVDQIGKITAQKVVSRFAPKNRIDAAVDRRWITPEFFTTDQIVDAFDKLQLLADVQSSYVMNAMYAIGREFDTTILNAMFGTAKTGEQGATSTAFNASNIISVNTGGTASGLNVDKLRAARKMLMGYNNDLDMERVCCAITSEEHDDLLSQIQITSLDFNERPTLVDGRVTRFLGIDFVHCEQLSSFTGTDDAAGTSRKIPVYMESAVTLGVWQDNTTNIHQRNDIQGDPWEVSMVAGMGATRTEENKIVQIWSR